jgi:hypothetical protein
MNITIGYGSSHHSLQNFVWLMSSEKEKLDSIAKTGTQVDFEIWLAHTIDPIYKSKKNYENLDTSRQICEILALRRRADLLTYFSSHHFFFGVTADIFYSKELVSDDCIPLYEWFYSIPANTSRVIGYESLIKKALELQQMQLYNWLVKNIPDFSVYKIITETIEICNLGRSYTTLKLFCDNFSPIYIEKEYKCKLIHYENAFQILQEFTIPEILNLIKMYC